MIVGELTDWGHYWPSLNSNLIRLGYYSRGHVSCPPWMYLVHLTLHLGPWLSQVCANGRHTLCCLSDVCKWTQKSHSYPAHLLRFITGR